MDIQYSFGYGKYALAFLLLRVQECKAFKKLVKLLNSLITLRPAITKPYSGSQTVEELALLYYHLLIYLVTYFSI